MQAASGNSSDKTAFSEIIKQHAKSFQAAIDNRYLVGDSALFILRNQLKHIARIKQFVCYTCSWAN